MLIFNTGHTRNMGDRWSLSISHGAGNDTGRRENLMNLHSSGAQLIGEILNATYMIIGDGDGDVVGHAVPTKLLASTRIGLLRCLDEAGAHVDGRDWESLGSADQLCPQGCPGRACRLRP